MPDRDGFMTMGEVYLERDAWQARAKTAEQRIAELETDHAQMNEEAEQVAQEALRQFRLRDRRIAELETDLKIADDMGHELDDQLHYAKAKLAAAEELERFDIHHNVYDDNIYRVPTALGDFVDADDLEALLREEGK